MNNNNDQQHVREDKKGVLYMVPTPIGNLEDMTYRAVRILSEVQYIAAEDTRHSIKLLNHFNIQTPLVSYHEHNKYKKGEVIIQHILDGHTVALVSDAGMPGISDPGLELVQKAIEQNIQIIPLPGANAALTGLIASGLSTTSFTFIGFLPRDKKSREGILETYQYESATIMLYESPYRVQQTLSLLLTMWGNRNVVIARELTKKYEEFIRGSLSTCIEQLEGKEVKGECCIFVEGASEAEKEQGQWWAALTIPQHVIHYIDQGHTKKEAIKQVAVDRDTPKREIYAIVMNMTI
ncbi:16S rRNA (cytidine(1402)-2'-O)-methyltransferase [Longirhabdus pacifica]|uniref:16S rRNA (cytidine(1402)-2'-O)-methyltransferase n=1 Tax=Longirhabdus pacifica TaxID=2305227 RepID=UPI0010088321|nr:16S rRNA (cytidine(1402)-2'-O)-methyltransferase [Longirhabdus pacifica]